MLQKSVAEIKAGHPVSVYLTYQPTISHISVRSKQRQNVLSCRSRELISSKLLPHFSTIPYQFQPYAVDESTGKNECPSFPSLLFFHMVQRGEMQNWHEQFLSYSCSFIYLFLTTPACTREAHHAISKEEGASPLCFPLSAA